MYQSPTQTRESSYDMLPLELIDIIVEFFREDKVTLVSLSHVSKAWLPLVQSRLFDRIRIKPPPLNERCDNILNHPTISQYIQHATLDLGIRIYGSNQEDEIVYLLGVIHRMKVSRMLKSLTIGLFPRPDSTPYQRVLRSLSESSGPFANVVQLTIWLEDGSLREIFDFACSFPRLHTLSADFDLAALSNNAEAGYASNPSCTLPESLRKLHLTLPYRKDPAVYVETWLSSHPPLPISDLSMLVTSGPNFNTYTPLCSSTLKNLTVRIDYGYRSVTDLHNCNLSSFDVLETLTVHNLFQHSHLSIIHRMMETLSSPRLRKLRLFDLVTHDVTFLEQLGTVDGILAAEKFSHTTLDLHFIKRASEPPKFSPEDVGKWFEKCSVGRRLQLL